MSTYRTLSIFQLLRERPMSTSEIAEELGINSVTVGRHIQRLRLKGFWIEFERESSKYYILGSRMFMTGKEVKKRLKNSGSCVQTLKTKGGRKGV